MDFEADAQGFVKTCVFCECDFAVFNEPVPPVYENAGNISRDGYDHYIRELKKGVCFHCSSDSNFIHLSDIEIIEILLEAENRKLGHRRAQKNPTLLQKLREKFGGDHVDNWIAREERLIEVCETELEKRQYDNEQTTEAASDPTTSKRALPVP